MGEFFQNMYEEKRNEIYISRQEIKSSPTMYGQHRLVCDKAHITLNKNAVCGDKSALSPGGVRIGTPALTTRGPPPDSHQRPHFEIASTAGLLL